MKVVVYSIKESEKQSLIEANHKRHDITLISNPLTKETALFAQGKDAVVVSGEDDVSARIINLLATFGVRFISTRSDYSLHINKEAAEKEGIKLANVPNWVPTAPAKTAEQTIINLDLWQQKKCVGDACACARNCRGQLTEQLKQQEIPLP